MTSRHQVQSSLLGWLEAPTTEEERASSSTVQKWRCDHCRVAIFDNLREAQIHEAGCQPSSPTGHSLARKRTLSPETTSSEQSVIDLLDDDDGSDNDNDDNDDNDGKTTITKPPRKDPLIYDSSSSDGQDDEPVIRDSSSSSFDDNIDDSNDEPFIYDSSSSSYEEGIAAQGDGKNKNGSSHDTTDNPLISHNSSSSLEEVIVEKGGPKNNNNNNNSVDSDDDSDCQIIDAPEPSNEGFWSSSQPAPACSLVDHSEDNDDDAIVVGASGPNALEDFPHARQDCVRYPPTKGDPERCCPRCYCYVCDIPAGDCSSWKLHCRARKGDKTWDHLRAQARRRKSPVAEAAAAAPRRVVRPRLRRRRTAAAPVAPNNHTTTPTRSYPSDARQATMRAALVAMATRANTGAHREPTRPPAAVSQPARLTGHPSNVPAPAVFPPSNPNLLPFTMSQQSNNWQTVQGTPPPGTASQPPWRPPAVSPPAQAGLMPLFPRPPFNFGAIPPMQGFCMLWQQQQQQQAWQRYYYEMIQRGNQNGRPAGTPNQQLAPSPNTLGGPAGLGAIGPGPSVAPWQGPRH